MEITRAKSVEDVLRQKMNVLPFDGEYADAFGTPELFGSWIIWGESGNGKTRLALQLAKYFTRFAKVAYNSLEEGISLSFKRALKASNMQQCKRKFVIVSESIEDLTLRLYKRKSPDVIIIDSLQYSGLTYPSYKQLRETFPNKLFIFISHADGKLPEGRTAKKIRYDAFVKIRVEGYKAFPVSRYGGGQPFIIWEDGALKYWSEINN